MNFLSDNAYGALPEIVAALSSAAAGTASSYGGDDITARVESRLAEIFETKLRAFAVISGTAANALALATLCPPHGAVLCEAQAHIAVDECGAPEFFTHGAKLIGIEGHHGKLTPASLETTLARFHQGFVHQAQPAVLSLTQSTEMGTVYSLAEIAALAKLAKAHGLKVHMDGARFANAMARLGISPAEATWKAGIDVLSFGATKNGALGAEAVIFFDPALAGDFEYRRKKSGHLISKMRFVSAQLEAYLTDDLWLKAARHANGLAQHLAEGVQGIAGVEILYPVEANEVFLRLPTTLAEALRSGGARFYDWSPPENAKSTIRLVTSFATPPEDVARFVELASK
ncbi:threonine aldolase [Rhizomicrobium palustre]|uniref:L-threonine aldolase n=1 Tax=Rhizomicrobium palustre TaxID=189966 RepID=A0A846N024_9PROT|nr:aminotransferase class I/II-fold pyridoxal phosphate-dependent enzyme [Rhizomicrobium palustre]NIK88550.1 threonine aldolase [Rhizomicrobium palustre]